MAADAVPGMEPVMLVAIYSLVPAKPDFHRELDRLQTWLPGWAARAVEAMRKPSAVWFRVPGSLLLIAGGFVGFLPILGFWMIPLGLALLALDLPFLRGPLARLLGFINRKLAPE